MAIPADGVVLDRSPEHAPGGGFVGHAHPGAQDKPRQALRNARGQFEWQHGEQFFRRRARHGEQGDDAALRVVKAREGAGTHRELFDVGRELSLEESRRIDAAECQHAECASTLRKVDTNEVAHLCFY